MKIYYELFIVFFKIGLFTLGGGFAMVPMIQQEIVFHRQWIKDEEFLNLLALAQSSPGPIAVNISVFVGYTIKGLIGMIATTLGCILPSFLIIISIAIFFAGVQNNPYVVSAFKAIRPAVVSLIAGSVVTMAKSTGIKKYQYLIPLIVTLAVSVFKLSPILVIIISAVTGIIYYGRKNDLS